jgi:uncharacterized DUF497 family protein
MWISWNEAKRESNLEKHGIDFLLASLILGDDPHVYASPRGDESRSVAVGEIEGRVIAVVYTQRYEHGEPVIRIISARRARTNEERDYWTLRAKR